MLFVCLFVIVWLSVCLCVGCLIVCLICLFVCLFVCVFAWLFPCLFVWLVLFCFDCLFVTLFVCLFGCLFVCWGCGKQSNRAIENEGPKIPSPITPFQNAERLYLAVKRREGGRLKCKLQERIPDATCSKGGGSGHGFWRLRVPLETAHPMDGLDAGQNASTLCRPRGSLQKYSSPAVHPPTPRPFSVLRKPGALREGVI